MMFSQLNRALQSLVVLFALLFPLRLECQELPQLIEGHAEETDFHGVILVEKKGTVLFHEAFGLANRPFQVPMAKDTRFHLASITKLVTSALILQLVDEGRLDLDSPLGTYLPEYNGEAKMRVTLHHLLNHTSGLKNFQPDLPLDEILARGLEVYQLPHTSGELLREHASGPLEAEPGTRFSYNNADYVILGKILEQAEGRNFEEILKERIVIPLEMKHSGMLRYSEIVPQLAESYMRFHPEDPLQRVLPVYPENWYAAGAMYGTAEDLLRFSRALFGGKLLSSKQLEKLLTPGLDEHGYGAWIATTEISGTDHRFLHRPGQIMGFNTLLLHYPDDDLTVIILANTNNVDTDDFGFRIGRWVLE